jgi:porphyrinogen peroxidase
MLRNMFLGNPPGTPDRLLDFSSAITGSLFFVTSADMMDDPPPLAGDVATGDSAVADPGVADEADGPDEPAPDLPEAAGASLGMGGLRPSV